MSAHSFTPINRNELGELPGLTRLRHLCDELSHRVHIAPANWPQVQLKMPNHVKEFDTKLLSAPIKTPEFQRF